MKTRILGLLLIALTCSSAALAQPGPRQRPHPGLQQRQELRQELLRERLRQRELPPRDLDRPEGPRRVVDLDEGGSDDSPRAGGRLTPEERRALREDMNRISRDIYQRPEPAERPPRPPARPGVLQ